MSERALTAELVFHRLEALREVLRLTDYLAGFRRAPAAAPLERAQLEGIDVVVLYRPTGPAEMALLELAAFRRWPPRLDEQPIFYPVTNERYAREIAEGWNVDDDGVAFVTRFHVRAALATRYAVETVGAAHHTELWVPAEDLDAFNEAIVGPIEVLARFEGQRG
jgi:hypothetical protein